MVDFTGGSEDTIIKSSAELDAQQFKAEIASLVENMSFLQEKTNKSLKNIQNELKKTTVGLNEVVSSTKKEAEAINLVDQGIDRMAKKNTAGLAVIQTKLKANYAILNTITSSFSYLLRYTVEFDKELRNLQAIVAISDTSLNSLKNTIVEVSNSTKYTSLELTKVSTTLGQAGYSVQQIKDMLEGIAVLATATGTDLNTAVDTVTSAINIYGLQAGESKRVTNALTTAVNESKADIAGFQYALQYAGKAAADLNISLEETAVAVAGATQAGIKSKSTLGTGLRSVLVELVAPTAKFKAQLESVGLTLDKVDVKSLGYTQVLKNLKNAGFGVEEAYKGMQRRTASFLTTQLSQIDFMENLQERMVGSTAAMKANENQMKALENTWANTQSILGSAAYEGLSPVVSVLQYMLKLFNDLADGNGGFARFLKGLTSATIIIPTVTIAAVGLMKTLGGIYKILVQMKELGTISTLMQASGSLGKIGLIVAGITIALGTIYAIYKSIDTSKSLGDYEADLERIKGASDKASESFNSFSASFGRLFEQKDKYLKENGSREIELFVNDMITRFPEVEGVLRKEIKTWEDLIERMIEARGILSELKYIQSKNTFDAQEKVTKKTSKEYGKDVTKEQISRDLELLSQFNLLEINQKDNINKLINQQGYRNNVNPFSKYDSRESYLFSSGGRKVGLEIYETLSKNLKGNTDALVNMEKLIASNNTPEELRELLKSIKDLGGADRGQKTSFLDKSVEDTFNKTSLKYIQGDYIKVLDGYKEKYKELFDSSNINTDEFIEKTTELVKGVEQEIINVTNSLGTEDFLNYLNQAGYDINELMKNSGVKTKEELVKKIQHSNLELINNITEDMKEYIEQTNDTLDSIQTMQLKERKKRLQQQLKVIQENYKNYSPAELNQKQAESDRLIRQIAETEKLQNLAEFDKKGNMPTLVLAESNAEVDKAMNEKLQSNMDKLNNVREAIDYASLKMDAYLKGVDTNVMEIGNAFEQAERNRERKYAETQGYIDMLRELYGSDAQADILEYDMKKAKRTEDLNAKKIDLQKMLSDYQNQLLQIQKEVDVEALRVRAELDRELLEKALKAGTSSQSQWEQLNKNANQSSKNYEDVAKRMNEIKEKIDTGNYNLQEILGQINAQNIDRNTPSSLWEGTKDGATNWLNKQQTGEFANLYSMMSNMTDTLLEDATTGFKNLFIMISDGSHSAGEAFKEMGKAMLQTIQEIAMEMAARQMIQGLLEAAFSAYSGGSEEVTESGGWSGGGSTTGYASGGPVVGGVANRDSVPTMLMPGEFVMKKKAVDALGSNFLKDLNNNNLEALQTKSKNIAGSGVEDVGGSKSKGGSTVNVWVVSEDKVPTPSSTDIVLTVSEEIRRGGNLKRLIKSVAVGG